MRASKALGVCSRVAMNALVLLPCFLLSMLVCVRADDAPVDFDKARQLFEKRRSGGTLTSEEQAYIERAKAAHDAQNQTASGGDIDWQRARQLHERSQHGEKLSNEDEAYLQKAMAARGGGKRGDKQAAAANQRKAPEHLKPLSDMSATDRYEGEDGGLYGAGSNVPLEPQRAAAEVALKSIQPLGKDGNPSPDGTIVFVSISMSNATMEFSQFKKDADASPLKSSKVTIVDCAQGGQAMAQWVPANGRPWMEAMSRIEHAGVTPLQVQVAWVKIANVAPSGSMKDHLGKLEADTTAVLQNAKQRFPNLRIAYLGSRIYAGYASTGLNPEPYAYEGAFGVRHLIQQQSKGAAELALDKAPLLLWGPYLWADGTEGRKLDSLTWEKTDFGGDGTHPSESGRAKVSKLLLDFFSTDALAKSWFTK